MSFDGDAPETSTEPSSCTAKAGASVAADLTETGVSTCQATGLAATSAQAASSVSNAAPGAR